MTCRTFMRYGSVARQRYRGLVVAASWLIAPVRLRKRLSPQDSSSLATIARRHSGDKGYKPLVVTRHLPSQRGGGDAKV